MPYVYITTNLLDGKKYIGVVATKNHKKRADYLGSGILLKRAIKKYGRDNFKKEIIKEFVTDKEAREYEKMLINKLCAKERKDYYNLCDGGYGGGVKGHIVSKKARKKISKKLTGKKRPKEVVEKIRKSLTGYKWSKESVEARLKGIKEYYKNADIKKLRKIWKKISEAKKGSKLKKETKEKLSKINSKHSDDVVLEIHKMILEGFKYKEISKKFNISLAQITAIKQHKTYKWLWKNH